MSMSEKGFLGEGNGRRVEELLDELDKLTGLYSVKNEVCKLVNMIIVEKEAGKAFMGPLHMVFKGGPGTGKTTVARIIGEIYTLLGVLPGNQRGVIECMPKELLGQYVGETAQKTRTRIDEAMGGVLLIEEAYSLMQNQFGRECINTLLIAMEEHRDDLVIIFTGSAKEMDEFLDYNMGLRSRIRKELVFEDYRKEDFESVPESYQIRDNHLDELLEEFNNMEGHDELKAVVNRTVYRVLAYRKMGYDVELDIGRLHMVFAGAPGTGKSTMARMVGAIYKELGILPRGDELIECFASDLIGTYIGQSATLVMDIIKRAEGRVLVVDEDYLLGNSNIFAEEACDALVRGLEEQGNNFMLILLGYDKELECFLDSNPGIRSRIPHVIHFEDYSVDQMVSIFEKMAIERAFALEKGTDDIIRKVLEKKSTDKDFGNARGVCNLLDEITIYMAERSDCDGDSSDGFGTIRKEDIQKLISTEENEPDKIDKVMKVQPANSETLEKLTEEFNNMEVPNELKAVVNRIINKVLAYRKRKEMGYDVELEIDWLHMVFAGAPGIGKSMAAHMIGQIYRELGVLRSGHMVECSRHDLVASYVGQTAEKTQAVINSAMGGILFVDEAYTLAGRGEDDFGKEALTTIMKAMEEHRDDLMVIFAGYSKEIDELYAAVPGFRSRIPHVIHFEDYTVDQMVSIFKKMAAEKKYSVEEEADFALRDVLKKKSAEGSFGNARGVRNLLLEAIDNLDARIANEDVPMEEYMLIKKEDIQNL